jgi:hypothetical protein
MFPLVHRCSIEERKTWLVIELIHLLKQMKLITDVLVLSPTAKLSHDFDAVVPPALQQPFDENKLWHIIARAEKAKQLGHYVHVLVVFDDGLGDSSLQHSKAMEYLFTKGRHANLSAIVISQAANRLLTPTIKASASHVLFGRLNPDACKVLAKSLFTGMRTTECEDWVHSNVGENYMFGVCQQGVAGLQQLKASASLPFMKLPPVATMQVVAAKFAALQMSDVDGDGDGDSDSDSDSDSDDSL